MNDTQTTGAQTAGIDTTDAQTAYDGLHQAWLKSDDWWGNGSMLDTLFDYLILTEAPASQLESLAEEGLQVARKGDGLWYDDFGWWGIAATKGFLKNQDGSYLLGSHAAEYQEISKMMFEHMYQFAPNVWHAFNQKYSGQQPKTYEPRHLDGVWNFMLDNHPVPGLTGTPNPPYPTAPGDDPKQPPRALTSRQNAVTNGLYQVLACRLFQHTQNLSYKAAALRHAAFLERWFKDSNESQRLVYPQSRGIVIRERVGGFKQGDVDPGFRKEVAWAGDQGLFLSALIDHRNAIGEPLTTTFSTVDILDGVAACMVETKRLQDWPTSLGTNIIPMTAMAYSCGSGVFLRYLTYAYQQDEAIRSAIAISDWLQIIQDTATDTPSPNGGDPTFRLFNRLAAWNALLAMKP